MPKQSLGHLWGNKGFSVAELFVRADQIEAKPIEWLWKNRIPRGAITIFDGEPQSGKTTVLTDLVARECGGLTMPETDVRGSGKAVLWISAEDNQATLQRNLKVSGGDLKKVFIFDRAKGRVTFPDWNDALRKEIGNKEVSIVVIDPLAAFLRGSSSMETIVRSALDQLAAVAETTGVAIILVRHLAKIIRASAMRSGLGSVGISAATRSGLLVGHETVPVSNDGNQRRIIAPYKWSLSGERPGAIAFSLVSVHDGVRVDWLGASDITADQLLTAANPTEATALSEACEILFGILQDGQPMWANEVTALATQAGVSKSTLRRARTTMGVLWRREGAGPGSRIHWRIPDDNELVLRLRSQQMDTLADDLVYGPPASPGN
jgi:hypothetical protein